MELRDFFTEHPRVALAYSGGVDSSCVLYAALQWAQDVGVYCVRSSFQPGFELDDALQLAASLGASVTLLDADVLKSAEVTANRPDRCYHCKKLVLACIREKAEEDGFSVLIDGTNADDDPEDRPGFRALEEEGVLSPLRLCSLTKADVRRISQEAGLFNWNKPAYACLATRIPTGEQITAEKLQAVEKAESALFKMGFQDFRVRAPQGRALVQVTADQQALAQSRWSEIEEMLMPLFEGVELDPKAREKSR